MEKSNKEETRFLLKTTDELLTMLTKRRKQISVMSNLRIAKLYRHRKNNEDLLVMDLCQHVHFKSISLKNETHQKTSIDKCLLNKQCLLRISSLTNVQTWMFSSEMKSII